MSFVNRPHMHPSECLQASEMESIAREPSAWGLAGFGRIGMLLHIVGEGLRQAVDLRVGEKALHVDAGYGNASRVARWYENAVSTDAVPALLGRGLRHAGVDGPPIVKHVEDAEHLPFRDGTFDAVLSTFGVMFAPEQEHAAAELVRVVRSGGRIALASWTPDSLMGDVLRVATHFAALPAGSRPPSAWGTEARIVELFGPYARGLRTERLHYVFRHPSAEHWMEVFRRYYGPVRRAFEALDAAGKAEFDAALLGLLQRHNRGGSQALIVHGDYLEVVVQCS